MEIARLALEFLEVLLSTQMVGGGVAILFIILFRRDISRLIGRIRKISGLGSEIDTSQPVPTEEELRALPKGETAELPQNITLRPEQAQQVTQLIQSERANAALWEYRYLNHFFVRATQWVLDALSAMPQPIGLNLLESALQGVIPNANERTAILAALENHHLLKVDAGMIEITPKGREYLQWRGPMPPVATNQTFHPPVPGD